MKTFNLPDLGEGLQEAEIVCWHVSEGDNIVIDQPLVSMETAKAIVEVPSPFTGRVLKLEGEIGDIVPVGSVLVEFDDGEVGKAKDKATVVGDVAVGKGVVEESAPAIGQKPAGIKVTPAVRALARRLKVELGVVTPSGSDGLITAADVERVSKIFHDVEPLEPLRGVRRVMAANMERAHAEVVAVTVMDEADVDIWPKKTNISLRLIRALIAACQAEPSLNAWYDSEEVGRRLLKKIHLGIAVDTPEGLFVPVLFDVASQTPEQLRDNLNRLKEKVLDRSLPAEELRGNTITLSNFGTIAGRFANPIVLPPTVAILGAGRIRQRVVVIDGQPAVRRQMPLSLTFDHRAIMGGEAARFLGAAIVDLELSD